MSRRVIVMLFVTVLVGAIWAERPTRKPFGSSAPRGRKQQLMPQP